ncbi:MAG: hypothetical protein M0C28_31985 [Candidatus Moduliflexus flocculans]|nr:hypothetical protein [Candidatus Moduliflexus flocculans]
MSVLVRLRCLPFDPKEDFIVSDISCIRPENAIVDFYLKKNDRVSSFSKSLGLPVHKAGFYIVHEADAIRGNGSRGIVDS